MKSILALTATGFAVIFIIATLVPFLRSSFWWIRAFDFPRTQVVVGACLTLILLFAVKNSTRSDWLLIGCLSLAILWQASKILPFTVLKKPEVLQVQFQDELHSVSIMVANVLTTNRQTDRFLDLVTQNTPDIVLTLETDEYWEQALIALEADYPHRVYCAQDNLYGMHLYSKLELVDAQVHFIVEADIPSIHTGFRLPSGDEIKLHCLHPAPPSPTENEKSIERDAELIKVAKRVRAQHLPTIVTGDLNDVAWSDTTLLFRKLSGLLDPRIGRGLFNTWHADYGFVRWPVDHVFHSNHFQLISLKRLGHFGSDHFPIYAELQFLPQLKEKQETPEADQDDKEFASDKLKEVLEDPSEQNRN